MSELTKDEASKVRDALFAAKFALEQEMPTRDTREALQKINIALDILRRA